MRRPRIRRMRREWINMVPEHRKESAWNNFRRQERWARRYGLPILRAIVMFFVGVVFVQLVAAWVTHQQASGGFSVD